MEKNLLVKFQHVWCSPPSQLKNLHEYIVKLSFLDAGASLQPVSLLTPFHLYASPCLSELPTY